MAKILQNNFSGGEISPSLYGRSDLQVYYKGCADAENFIISKEGTLRKRHGISSVMALPEAYSRCKILPYKYDRTQGGFILLYHTAADPTTVTAKFYAKDGTLHTWTEGGSTVSSRTISNFAGSIKDLQHKQIGDEIWTSNGSAYYTIRVTNNESFSVSRWTQAAAPSVVPRGSSSTSNTGWYISPSEIPREEGDEEGPSMTRTMFYGCIGVKNSINATISKQQTMWSTTWEAGTYIDLVVTVKATDIGNWDSIIVAKRTGGSYGKLAEFYMDDDADETYAGNVRIYKWSDGKYYTKPEDDPQGAEEKTPTAYRWIFKDENHLPTDLITDQTNTLGSGWNNPLCVDCFQQRRVFANAETSAGKFPMTMWFSEVGNLDNFYSDRPAEADDAFSPTVSSPGPAFILFTVCYQEAMILFTGAGLFTIGFSQQQGFSSGTCRISKFSDITCSPTIQPVVTEAGVVFVGADNKTVYSVAFDAAENALKPTNRSVMTEHLTRTTPIVGMALQSYPDNVIWIVTSDGKACTFTVEKNEQVYSWSHSKMSGADFLDVVGIGTCTDSTTDRTYADMVFAVRKGNSEYLAVQNSGYADIVGGSTLAIEAKMTTLKPESQEQTMVGNRKNIKDVIFRLYQSGGIKVRPADNGVPFQIPFVGTSASALFTGDVKVMPRGFVSEDGQMTILSDDANPCEILQVVTKLEVD